MEKELRKQILQRNIVFWGKLAEKYIITVMGIILCYVFFFSYLGGNNLFTNRDIWSVLFIYQVMLMMMSALIAPMSYGMLYIPMVISFGSKRKEAVWGFQLMNWLVIGELGTILLLFASQSSIASGRVGVIAGISLVVGIAGIALGQFVTAVGLRFGMKAIWFIILTTIILLVIVGGVIVFLILREDNFLSVRYWWLAVGAVIAVGLYTGSIVLLLWVVRRYEVQR